MNTQSSCWHCHSPLDANQFHRLDSCEKCGRDTHVCKNCDHHDRAFNNECKESSADRVVDKEKSNFCDYFVAGKTSRTSELDAAAKARALAEALFKKK